MSKPAARNPNISVSGFETSLVRCALALLLVLGGIAWITFYTQFAMDAAEWVKGFGKKPDTPFPKHWLYYITLKFAVIAAALLIALYVAYHLLRA